jgi:hypothetical protein
MTDRAMCLKGLHPNTPEYLVANGNGKKSCGPCRAAARAAKPPCAIKGCPNQYRSHGWCQTHYEKWRIYGDPIGGPKRLSAAEILEEVLWLVDAGMSSFYIADALQRDRETLSRLMYRVGRPDLAVRFDRVEDAA